MSGADSSGRPRMFNDPVYFEERVDAYFDHCEKKNKHPVVAGLCYFLGFHDRHALQEYRKYDGFSATVKRALLRIEAHKNEMLFERDYSTAGVIFDLKNNHNWSDKIEHGEMTPGEFGEKVIEYQRAMERMTVPADGEE